MSTSLVPTRTDPLTLGADIITDFVRADRMAALFMFLMPLPFRWTSCGFPIALSWIITSPDLGPLLIGVKVTVIVQELPGARLAPHVCTSEKLEKPCTISILEILSVASPVFVSIVDRDLL